MLGVDEGVSRVFTRDRGSAVASTGMSERPFDFDEDVIMAVIGHMNAEHRHDSLSIVRALAGEPDATEAVITDLSAEGVGFDVRSATSSRRVVVPWGEVPLTRADIRHELVRMTESSSR